MSRAERLPRCTATWQRRSSVARKRASMREGPLAELFRATEAAQRKERGEEHDEPTAATPAAASPKPAPKRAQEKPVQLVQAEQEQERPPTRWLEPIPDNPARLERARETASYLAVIRVVGVGGA